jgi:hypothetical protein
MMGRNNVTNKHCLRPMGKKMETMGFEPMCKDLESSA